MSAPDIGGTWAAVVPAAGSSRRMGFDKLLARIHGVPVLTQTLWSLRGAGLTRLVVGVRDVSRIRAEALVPYGLNDVIVVAGGDTRAETVAVCLSHLPEEATHVVVHDGARPYCSWEVMRRVMAAAWETGAASAALPAVDTVHRVRATDDCIAETVDRRAIRLAQTPQAFQVALLRRAHRECPPGSDDAGMVAALGISVRLVEGGRENVKLTVPSDMPSAGDMAPPPFAVGLGHDVHRLVPGRPLILGGVKIPFERGLMGHSDADALSHAVADAVLGAAGLGDIGQHFPPDDPAYTGANSLVLLARCRQMAVAAGWRPVQADCIVIAEEPRLSPHVDPIRATLSGVLCVQPHRVNVKCGTNEGLGHLGRGEGVAAHAVVLAVRARVDRPNG